jgi:hypothetical protein
MPKEIRKPKSETAGVRSLRFSGFGFLSDFAPSDFGFLTAPHRIGRFF